MEKNKPQIIDLDYQPHSKQKELHQLCKEDGVYFVVVNAGRQSGKTFAAQTQAVMWALENAGCRVWIVAPSETQSNRIYKELISILRPSGLIEKTTSSKGNIEIQFINKSIIDFKSGAMEDNLRGYSVDYMVVDEGSFIDRNTFETVLLPTLNVRGKKILIISTPRGRNWFYEYYSKGDDIITNPSFRNLKFTYQDNPLANLDLINVIKSSIPEKIFQQEYLAEWVDGGQVFNNISTRMIAPVLTGPRIGERYFIGVDIGLINDYTVITVINNLRQVVFIDRFRGMPTPVIKERIIKAMNNFRAEKVSIEMNGVGLPISQELMIDHKEKIIQFSTSNLTKGEIISNLIAAFENEEIEIPNNEDLYKELNGYGFSFSPTGKILYSSIYGHDDMVMSLAIAYFTYQQFSKKTKTIIMI